MPNKVTKSHKAILRPNEAAQFLGLSESTLAKRRLTGEPPKYVKLGSRAVGYSLEVLESYIKNNSCESTSDPGTKT